MDGWCLIECLLSLLLLAAVVGLFSRLIALNQSIAVLQHTFTQQIQQFNAEEQGNHAH